MLSKPYIKAKLSFTTIYSTKNLRMDKFLCPDRFEADPSSSSAAREWKHWHRTFKNLQEAIQKHKPERLKTLVNYLAPRVYEFIADCQGYEAAITTLEKNVCKPLE